MILNEARLAAALPAYELGSQLGRGAFGVVLAGRHRELGRDVAIKVLPIGEGRMAEARLLALLDHPHVVRVFDAVTVDDLHLIVMELLPGGTLTHRAAGISTEAVCAVGLAVAAALACAHQNGVLHRDIKPENILFDRSGLLKVTDFGIAKLVEGAAADASASAVIGTPRYMAPEQLLAGRLSAATDLYSLATMLYELSTGKPPYGAGLPAPSLIAHHLNVLPPPPVGVPARISQVLMRALAKEPAARQPSAHAFAVELAHAAVVELGPGWLARSGLAVRLDDEVRAAADGHPFPHQAARAPYQAARAPHQSRSQPPPPYPVSRPGRRAVVGLASVLVVGVAGLLFILLRNGGDGGDSGRRLAGGGVPDQRSTAPPSTSITAQPPARVGSRNAPELLSTPLAAHTAAVWTVKISPRGDLMATGGDDQVVLLWDVSDPTSPRDLGTRAITHLGRVEDVAFAPDGRTLAVAGEETLRLWDISNPVSPRALGAPLTGYAGLMYSVAFAPGGRLLAAAGSGQAMVLWDVADRARPRLVTRLDGHTASVTFAPDGRTAASGDGTRAVLWDVTAGSSVRATAELPSVAAGWVYAIAFSPDGRTVATAGDARTVQLWDITTPTEPTRLGAPLADHSATVPAVAFSPDGRTLATGSDDGTVLLWDVTDRTAPSRLGEPLTSQSGFSAVAFSPDGHMLATAGGDRLVRLWGLG
ncbi:serine/threonine protein kinase [Frankia sp. EI5c]|uniref:WD40 repeat domain-containing serine/threonine protein kinase n=1 Tax=Frankia sp. EI5c TaxID=683316 RepID=UPI0007C2FB76|nr:serine/threonine-protein kinase [Frankia sp. EI5c]OAA20129.1 serine/threonine protein kinase [Frankia sp. EI5c]